jgi:hypothetical protein
MLERPHPIDQAIQGAKKPPHSSLTVGWAPVGNVNGQITVPSQGETGKLIPSSRPVGSTPTMTADALLNLALAIYANPKSNPLYPLPKAKDPDKEQESLHLIRKQAVENGLKALVPHLGDQQDRKVPLIPVRSNFYYALWSVGQTANAFGLEYMAGKDWHEWGSRTLLANQKPDGSWQGSFSTADTCFALLFLKKTNLVPEVTEKLRGIISDPVLLKALPTPIAATPGSAIPLEERKTEELLKGLAKATTAQQAILLAQARDAKGPIHTRVLALAIPKLNGPVQTRAREALVERLGRLKNDELTDFLDDAHPELRRGAAAACGLQSGKSREYIPKLIPLLEDEIRPVATAAHRSLVRLSGTDHGPGANASAEQRAAAIAAWNEWWSKKQGDPK